jgi:hypothetical protein
MRSGRPYGLSRLNRADRDIRHDLLRLRLFDCSASCRWLRLFFPPSPVAVIRPLLRPSRSQSDNRRRDFMLLATIGKSASAAAVLTMAAAGTALAQEAWEIDLTRMSIEELANIEITSVSRRAEALSQAPAAVYVITREDIRRSGATSLPEALRLAPNLQVARIEKKQL